MIQFITGLTNHFITKLEKQNFRVTGIGGVDNGGNATESNSSGNVEASGTQELDMGSILWVVTVPAIWTEVAKKFMRTAAERVSKWSLLYHYVLLVF